MYASIKRLKDFLYYIYVVIYIYEMEFKYRQDKPDLIEVGIDEAGRGSLLGPVYAAAVIWSPDTQDALAMQIKDSKKLSPKKREELAKYIEENAEAFSVGFVNHEIIDKINILNASYKAMHIALDDIKTNFDHIIVDGNRFKTYISIKSGDRKSVV